MGKGEVNSAYDGLMALTGIVMPIFWARAYSFFVSPPGWVPGLLRWGPGGAFNLAGVMLLLSWWAVRSADRSTLYVSATTPKRSALKFWPSLPRDDLIRTLFQTSDLTTRLTCSR